MDQQPPDPRITQPPVPAYRSRHRSTATLDGDTLPYPRVAAHRAAPGRWWRRLAVRPRIALLAVGLLVLIFGAFGAVNLIAGAPTSGPTTSADDAAAASAPSPDAAAESPSATPDVSASTATASGMQGPQPVIEKRIVTETQAIAFDTRTVKDNTIAKGTSTVRTSGVPGVRTLTYEVTLIDGVQSAKKLVQSVVTKDPITEVVAVGTKPTPRCDPNYRGPCVPIASDVDCAGTGDGPAYVDGPVRVVGTDIYHLDDDGDNIGCEP